MHVVQFKTDIHIEMLQRCYQGVYCSVSNRHILQFWYRYVKVCFSRRVDDLHFAFCILLFFPFSEKKSQCTFYLLFSIYWLLPQVCVEISAFKYIFWLLAAAYVYSNSASHFQVLTISWQNCCACAKLCVFCSPLWFLLFSIGLTSHQGLVSSRVLTNENVYMFKFRDKFLQDSSAAHKLIDLTKIQNMILWWHLF